MAQALPNGWVSVPWNDATGALTTCAGLLSKSSPDSTQTTAANLSDLLKATYNEKGRPNLPLFFLYYSQSQQLCVAFYKSINRGKTATTVANGGAKYRRWCITLGVAAKPATGWSYTPVNTICTYFYYSVLDSTIDDRLCLAEDHNRTPDPKNYEVDACALELANDKTVQKAPLSMAEGAHFPWIHLHGPKVVDFTQLTL